MIRRYRNPGRRRSAGIACLAAVLTVTASGCNEGGGTNSAEPPAARSLEPADAVQPEGDGKARCNGLAIGYVGTINGNNADLGRNIRNGVDLAVRRHNKANPKCHVKLIDFDTEGLPVKASGVAAVAASQAQVIGVVGLPFSDESKVAGGVFAKHGLVQITPAATSPALSGKGWRTFFRGTGDDDSQAKGAADFLTGRLNKRKVCVVHDDSRQATALAGAVDRKLGGKVACTEQVRGPNYDDVVARIAKKRPDAVYYAGLYETAAPFAKQLAADVRVPLVTSDGAMSKEFVSGAGKAAASRAYFTCACVPGERYTAFRTSYAAEFGANPGAYSVEGFDAATVLLRGIDKGNDDRKALLKFVDGYTGQALSNRFRWDGKGELEQSNVWIYKVSGGQIVPETKLK